MLHYLLKFIRCKCSAKSKNMCCLKLNTCSCRKNGLKCVAACSHCHGENCRNVEEICLDDNDGYENESNDIDRNIFVVFSAELNSETVKIDECNSQNPGVVRNIFDLFNS